MVTNIQINCSGALFSSLQYELINKKKLQEGFLLGHVEKYTSHSISDSEINNENTNIVVNISGYIPCSATGSFYSGSGRVNFPYIKRHIESNKEKVVGWYRSRKFSDSMYLKEMRIHEQLREEMSHTDGHFIFALFSRIQPAETGTMDVHYKFQIMLNNKEFEGVRLRIVNMTDTSSQSIRTAHSAPLYNSKALEATLQSLKNLEPGVKEAEQLHNGLLNQLRSLLPKFADIQEQHYKALQQVNQMHEFCHSSEIKPDFRTAETPECNFNLMDFESLSPKLKSRPVNKSAPTVTESQKTPTDSSTKTSDPFGFVEKEMEKHQENGITKKKLLKNKKEQSAAHSPAKTDSESETSSTKSKTKKLVKKTTTPSGDAEAASSTSTTPKGRGAGHASSASPSRKTSKDSTSSTPKSANSVRKTRSFRGGKINSFDGNSSTSSNSSSPSSSAKHRSPSSGVLKTPAKMKEKEGLPIDDNNKVASDSPEF